MFSWEDATNLGVDVEDGMEFYGIEFRAILPEGQTANVIYSSDPSEIIINRIASGNFNIFEPDSVKNGTITTIAAIPDVFFNFKTDTDIFCKGDQVCYDLEVEEFDSIISMQIAIKWSGNVLKFDHAENFGLARLENSLNVNTNNGIVDSVARAIWGAETIAEFEAGGVSLPNGTTILTMCFNIVGEPNEETLIEIGNAGNTIIELIHNDFSNRDIIPNNPKMTVTDCDNLVIFAAECSDGVLNDTVCIDITASNFTDINAARYTLNWDPSILEFIKTDNYNLPELSAANFNSNAGSLVFDWRGMNATGYNVSDGRNFISCLFFSKSAKLTSTSFCEFS